MTDKYFLGREQILAAKRKTVEVNCPVLGGWLTLKELSLGQMREIDINDQVQALSQMIVDPQGQLMFADPEGLEALRQISAVALLPLIEAAGKLNGSSESATKELEKNSEASPTSASASA